MIAGKRNYILASYRPWGCKRVGHDGAHIYTSLGWFKLKYKIWSSYYHESDTWSEEGSPDVAHPRGPVHCPTAEETQFNSQSLAPLCRALGDPAPAVATSPPLPDGWQVVTSVLTWAGVTLHQQLPWALN